MTDAANPSKYSAAVEGDDENVDAADVSGGAVPEQLLEDADDDGTPRR